MEPFAAKTPRKSLQLHWWVTAGVAGAFFVWSFDLIPRIRSAATGVVADTASSAPVNDEKLLDDLSALDGDWSDIQEDTSAPSEDPNADPLMIAGRKSRPKKLSRDQATRQNDPFNEEPIRDAAITRASYDDSEGNVETADLSESSDADFSEVPVKRRDTKDIVIPAEVAEQLRNINQWIEDDRVLDAHAELSRLYWKQPDLRSLFQDRIQQTASMIFTSDERQFGPPHFVEYGETLETIAKQYDVQWMYLANLNGVDPEELQAGQKLKVVRGPFGAVVDLSEFTLTIHAHGWYVNHYTIGTGKDQKTPLGEFTVKEKLENPTWYNPDGGIVDPDDPENPLGEYWLGLGDHIGIHGTNDPSTISRAASRGCIHLDDSDIAEVFSLLGSGSKVLIRR
jgi:lipoprotein-anchoring transpeptidase ErfK/SrfK